MEIDKNLFDGSIIQKDEIESTVNFLLDQVEKLSCMPDITSNGKQGCNFEPQTSGWRPLTCIDINSTSEEDEDSDGEIICVSDEDSETEFKRIFKLSKQSKADLKNRSRKTSSDVHFDPEYYQLPPIENLQINVNEDVEIEPFGKVLQHIEFIVVVKPFPNLPQLDLDSILLDKERNAVGKIFEVFGPVVEPLYSIRFNSEEEVSKLPIGMELFYAPKMDDLTKRIFADDLLKKKWSDPNTEIYGDGSEEEPDFSDDEAEKRYLALKRQQRNAATTIHNNDDPRRPPPKRRRPMNRGAPSQRRPFNSVRFPQQRPQQRQAFHPPVHQIHGSTSQFYGQFFNPSYPAPSTNYHNSNAAFGQVHFFHPPTIQPYQPDNTLNPSIIDTRYMPRQNLSKR